MRNFTTQNFTTWIHVVFFLNKLNTLKFLLAFKNLQSCYFFTNICAKVSIKHKKKSSLDNTVFLQKIEIPCDKIFLCSKILCSKVNYSIL